MGSYTRGKYTFVSKRIKINDNELYHLSIRPPMSDAEYDDIKYRIERLGGHWRERFGGFVFDIDPVPELEKPETWEDVNHSDAEKWRIMRQFYPTPQELAYQVFQMCEIGPEHSVLEPSAGLGALLNPIGRVENVYAVEIDDGMASILEKMGYNVIHSSIEDAIAVNAVPMVDRVVMNPPFGPNQLDIKHIMLAYQQLKPGGILVGIMGENDLYYNTPLTKEFNAFLKSVNAEVTEVPIRSFLASGTRVDTVIVKITKPE